MRTWPLCNMSKQPLTKTFFFRIFLVKSSVVSRQWAIRKTRACSRWRLWGMRDYNFVQQFLHGCLGAGKITDAVDGNLQ